MKHKHGFAAMDKDRLKEVTSKGGKSAHAKGVAHEFTHTEAKSAGQLGGKALASNRAHMRQIGKTGGINRALKQGYRSRFPAKSDAVIDLENRVFPADE